MNVPYASDSVRMTLGLGVRLELHLLVGSMRIVSEIIMEIFALHAV